MFFVYVAFAWLGYWFGGKFRNYAAAFLLAYFSGVIADPYGDAVKAYEYARRFFPVERVSAVEEKSAPSIVEMADKAAKTYGIEPLLFRALIKQESNWNPKAVSHAGASGLTQLMPTTALSECGLTADKIFDIALNLDCGAYYFAKQLTRFGSVELALAAYNSGPDRVAKLGRVPRIKETQKYVSNIVKDWEQTL